MNDTFTLKRKTDFMDNETTIALNSLKELIVEKFDSFEKYQKTQIEQLDSRIKDLEQYQKRNIEIDCKIQELQKKINEKPSKEEISQRLENLEDNKSEKLNILNILTASFFRWLVPFLMAGSILFIQQGAVS